MKINKKLLIALISIPVIGLIVYVGIPFYHKIQKVLKNNMILIESAPEEYINLINQNYRSHLSFRSGVKFDLRNPLVYLTYDKKYFLEITKINLKSQFELKSDLVENFKETDENFPSTDIVPYNEGSFTSNYRGISNDTISKGFMSLYGDSIKTILRNDSTTCYYFKLKQFHIQYDNPAAEYKIYTTFPDNPFHIKKPPLVSVALIKKGSFLYFILLTPAPGQQSLDPNLLCDLIKGDNKQ